MPTRGVRPRPVLLDSTLRDGEQAPGVVLTAGEKSRYISLAERLGVSYFDVGFPSNQFDFDATRRACRTARHSTIAVLSLLTTESLDRAVEVGAGEVILVVPSSKSHLDLVYGRSLSALCDGISNSVDEAARRGLRVNIGLEDAGARDYRLLAPILDVVKTTLPKSGCVTIADTKGELLPNEVVELVGWVRRRLGRYRSRLAFHAHDDLGLATANSVAALTMPGGVDCVHVTTLGFGERAGNASLEQVATVASLKLGLDLGIDLRQLPKLCAFVEKAFLTPIPQHAPVVGRKVFIHESGLHQKGLLANPAAYQFVTPATVGRRGIELVLGKHSGKSMRQMLARRAKVDEAQVLALQARISTPSDKMKTQLSREVASLANRVRQAGFLALTAEESAAVLGRKRRATRRDL